MKGKLVEEAQGLNPHEIYQMFIYFRANYIQENTLFLEQVVLK